MHQLETLLIVLYENQWEDSLFQGSPEFFSSSVKIRTLGSRLTKHVTDPSEFYKILLDDSISNLNVQFIKDDMVHMSYNFKNHFFDNTNNTNIYISCFTTSHARLTLYDKLEYLQEKVLYFDTDWVIYMDGGSKNIKSGDILGEMADELSGAAISLFVSTGPKSYNTVLNMAEINRNRLWKNSR